jgi:hypothetical protein
MAIEDAIHELRTEMREGFSRVEQRLDGHDTRFRGGRGETRRARRSV